MAIGRTGTLTVGADTVNASQATLENGKTVLSYKPGAGNDTFNGNSATLEAVDSINGEGGENTLNVTYTAAAANALLGADVRNIQVMNIRSAVADVADETTDNVALDADNLSTLTNIYSDRSTGDVKLTNVGAGDTVGMIGNGTATNGGFSFAYKVPTGAVVLDLKDGVKQTTATNADADTGITNTGAGATKVTINSTGAANTVGNVQLSASASVTDLTINAATNLTVSDGGAGAELEGFGTNAKITIAGAATSVNIGTLEATTVKTVDASGLTAGGVTLTQNARTDAQITGGKGDDKITSAGILLAENAFVKAGDGTADRLTLTAAIGADQTAITAAEKASAARYEGFEQLQLNGVAQDVTIFSGSTIGSIRIDATANPTAANKLTAAQAQAVTIVDDGNTITLGLTGATTNGQIDTVKAALETTTFGTNGAADVANNLDLTALTLTGVEKLELTGNGVDTALTGKVTLGTDNARSLDSIKLANKNAVNTDATDNNAITISINHTATNLVVDASGSGDTTIDASLYAQATGAGLYGGAGNDVLLGSAAGDKLSGGAGNDSLTGEVITTTNNAAVKETSTIAFAAAYDAGDVITITYNGVAYNKTVQAGTLLATGIGTDSFVGFVDGGGATLKSVLASATTGAVVSWNGNTASLQSAVAGTTGAFTLAAAVTNTNGVAVTPAKQELTIATHPGTGVTDTISINVGGNTLTFKVKDAADVESLDYTGTTLQADLLTALNAKTITLSASDGTGKVVITGKDDGSALNLVQFASSSNATPGVTLASTAANTPATAQANPVVTETIAAAAASTTKGSSAWAADTLTGGEGKDTFIFSSGTNDTTKLDTITDLDLGSATVGGQVDNLSFYVANTGVTKALVELTSGQQASVTAAGTLGAAAGLVFAAAGTAGNVAKFTYGNDTYIAYNADGGSTFGTADFVIKVTGVAGTLDVSDINLLSI